MVTVAINGFGRIGRLFFRQAFGREGIEIVAVNDLGEIEQLAYLLQHDTVYRRYGRDVRADREGSRLIVGEKEVRFLQEKDPARLPWRDLGVDVVVESTGAFESYEKAKAHLASGAKRVVISAPAEDADGPEGRTVLLGINEKELAAATITSNGSCTTNAVSPVIAVLAANPGILKASLSTVHGYTATQGLVDQPTRGKDLRRGRAAAENIVPSTTGAAIAITRALPELAGKFHGVAMRVPVISGSIADITFVSKRPTSAEEVNAVLTTAAASPEWQGILKVTDEPIVSSDVIGEPYAAIVDARLTQVVDGDLVKVLSWYDNEWGYAATLVRHVERAAAVLGR